MSKVLIERCPPDHVRRLASLNCPVAEISRISGYTAEEIAKMIAEKPAAPPRYEDENPAYRSAMIDAGRGRLLR